MAEKRKPIKDAVDSAQQLWTAGVGAISKAQEESNRVLENLVKEGHDIQERTVKFADSVSSKATQHWDKLEQVFEERVARALGRLGVPTNKDVQQLTQRIDQLSATIDDLTGKKAAPTKRTTRAKKPAE